MYRSAHGSPMWHRKVEVKHFIMRGPINWMLEDFRLKWSIQLICLIVIDSIWMIIRLPSWCNTILYRLEDICLRIHNPKSKLIRLCITCLQSISLHYDNSTFWTNLFTICVWFFFYPSLDVDLQKQQASGCFPESCQIQWVGIECWRIMQSMQQKTEWTWFILLLRRFLQGDDYNLKITTNYIFSSFITYE